MTHRFEALKRVFEKYERGMGIAVRVLADHAVDRSGRRGIGARVRGFEDRRPLGGLHGYWDGAAVV